MFNCHKDMLNLLIKQEFFKKIIKYLVFNFSIHIFNKINKEMGSFLTIF